MSYLNPPYKNNFQELCAAMPLYYLDVFEMRAILRAQGYLLDGLCGGMEKLVDVNFILTADDATIRKWEKALKITYRNSLTLDQRKAVVISYLIGLGHIGEKEIRDIVGQYTSDSIDFDFYRGAITITVNGEVFDVENLFETLVRRIPAHLGITFHDRFYEMQSVIGMAFQPGLQVVMPIPELPDDLSAETTLHAGGAVVSSLTVLPVPEQQDDLTKESLERVGGNFGITARLPQMSEQG